MLVHHAFALIQGQGIPGAGLHERVDKQILFVFERNYQARIRRAPGMLPDVDRTFGHRKECVRLAQVRSHHTAPDAAAESLQVIHVVGGLPQHQVAVRTQPIQAVAAYQRMPLEIGKDVEQFLLALLARLAREQIPLRIKFVEGETHQLAGLLWFSRRFCLPRLCHYRLFCHVFSSC